MVKRRKVLIGAGSLLAGGAAATGTGAFSNASTGGRGLDIDVEDDSMGILSLGPAGFSDGTEGSYPNSKYVKTDGDGLVWFDLQLKDQGGSGDIVSIQDDAVYYIDQALEIHLRDVNQVSGPYNIQVQDGIPGFTPYTGTTNDVQTFNDPAGQGSNNLNSGFSGNLGTLNPGDSFYVGFEVDTRDVTDAQIEGGSWRVKALKQGGGGA
jgi:hypothetical protein